VSESLAIAGSDYIALGFRRGDYITLSGMSSYGETTSGLARGKDESGRRRITDAGSTTLTVRECSRWKAIEASRAWVEDRIVWPLSDLVVRFRSRPDGGTSQRPA
jgi:hypothetical protein